MSSQSSMGLDDSVSSESMLSVEYLAGAYVYATGNGKGRCLSMRAPVSLQDVPAQLCSIRTPLKVSVWERELESHCKRMFAN